MTKNAIQPTRPNGISAIAVYFFIVAAFDFIGACAILLFPLAAVMSAGNDGSVAAIAALTSGLCATVVLGALSLAAGIGLMRLATWARWLAFALASLSLILFPIGTIIGVIIIWYLLRQDVRQAFETADS